MNLMRKGHFTILCFFALAVISCATHELRFSDDHIDPTPATEDPALSIYLLGDAGNSPAGGTSKGITAFQKAITKGHKNDLLLILGDNIYEKGMPSKSHPDRALATHRLQVQLEAVKDFKGKIVVIPGNHDWYSNLSGLKAQEKFTEKYLDHKDVFLPENGCGLTEVDIDGNTHLIVIDSQWYLEDWDEHPTMNDDCEIKTRKRFFTEFESMLKKQEGKTVVIAIHHPLDTYGPHGGYFSARKHLFPFQKNIPLPGLASLIAITRSAGGVSPQDLQNRFYRQFTDRIKTIVSNAPVKPVFVSGHEHTLQYIDGGSYKQIVSGSGSKTAAARQTNNAVFTYGYQGFARLDIHTDGSSTAHFYGTENDQPIFSTRVFPPNDQPEIPPYPAVFPDSVRAAVYPKEAWEVSGVHKSLWGDHYRELYGIEVLAPTVRLDTLYGGLTPVRMGGGHQSKTLRLRDSAGREYNMRALKKSGVKFLQTVVLNDKNLSTEDLTGTLPDKLLMDFFTAAHPYASFVVPELSRAAGVYHTNPRLFYIPKQSALGTYNNRYGDALYMIEERPGDAFAGAVNFGQPDEIESTDKLYEQLREDEENRLDENSYLRARLFDMLIGDWDRHGDQWRWAEFHKKGGKVYRPIPRDRDQAFSDFDGALLSTARTLAAPARMVQRYEPEVNNLAWFNIEPLPMDRVLIQQSTKEDYLREATYLQEHLTDAVIENAFKQFPKTIAEHPGTAKLITTLKARRNNLQQIAKDYNLLLSDLVVLHGTDKDDLVLVERLANKKTRVSIRRIKDGVPADTLVYKTYNPEETKEIWIYALDDDDVIRVTGKGQAGTMVRIVGGQNNDIYHIENGKRVRIYDHRSKPNTIKEHQGGKIRFTDQYDLNHFDFNKNRNNSKAILPGIGFNPDAGIITGLSYTRTHNGFERNPFTTKHSFSAYYHFATNGLEFNYDGAFAGVFDRYNLIAGGRITNPTFTRNFFGFGSNTSNEGETLGYDYYRVNMSHANAYVGLSSTSDYGGSWRGSLAFDAFEIENNEDRFLGTIDNTPEFYDWKYFLNLNSNFRFENYDQPLNPRRGMLFQLETGYTYNLKDSDHGVFYLKPKWEIYYNLTSDKALVLKTNISGHVNIANDFEFYQGAFLGGNSGLRGYRLNRFTGRNAMVINGDLRYNFKPFRTGVLPLQMGIYTGYDLGRVWHPNDTFNTWHDSYGGGIYAVAGKLLAFRLGYFISDEDQRFGFGLGFNL
ncbi:metallophosphoesterase [Robertkochia sediminum]|uniref:metallophosphoesterase n=1 Tax=Robertkochia sediminum TaxID=2785326 RepID=UPI0019325574|nr:metallophosphoesterase [Robertkochia sediminum]MBL7473988.1 metallophosphoesterase [Robertkochia sediminum]